MAGKKRMSKRNNVIKGARGKRAPVPPKRGGRKARKRVLSPPENREIAPDLQEERKTCGIFSPLLFSGFFSKSTLKNTKKYNSFRRFIEYLPVFDTPLRPFPTAVGFCAKARADAIGCGTTEHGASDWSSLWWGGDTRRGSARGGARGRTEGEESRTVICGEEGVRRGARVARRVSAWGGEVRVRAEEGGSPKIGVEISRAGIYNVMVSACAHRKR